jgi:hypothetical protein
VNSRPRYTHDHLHTPLYSILQRRKSTHDIKSHDGFHIDSVLVTCHFDNLKLGSNLHLFSLLTNVHRFWVRPFRTCSVVFITDNRYMRACKIIHTHKLHVINHHHNKGTQLYCWSTFYSVTTSAAPLLLLPPPTALYHLELQACCVSAIHFHWLILAPGSPWFSTTGAGGDDWPVFAFLTPTAPALNATTVVGCFIASQKPYFLGGGYRRTPNLPVLPYFSVMIY